VGVIASEGETDKGCKQGRGSLLGFICFGLITPAEEYTRKNRMCMLNIGVFVTKLYYESTAVSLNKIG